MSPMFTSIGCNPYVDWVMARAIWRTCASPAFESTVTESRRPRVAAVARHVAKDA